MEKVILAVNGTLMRGLELAGNLKKVHASFIKKSQTEKAYRLYSINDQYPAMIKSDDGESIAVELYKITEEGMKEVLSKEPEGLTIEKIKLIDGQEVYGVIGLPSIVEGQKDIRDQFFRKCGGSRHHKGDEDFDTEGGYSPSAEGYRHTLRAALQRVEVNAVVIRQ